MTSHCATCGYRSTAQTFFRQERGGLLGLRQSTCGGCNPYRPSKLERKLFRSVFVVNLGWVGIVTLSSGGNLHDALPMLILVEAALLSSWIRTVVHEGGHALAAKALGAHVVRVTVGGGPTWKSIRLGQTRVDVRRYTFLGGATLFLWPEGSRGRWRSILIILAGPAANVVFAGLALWASSAFHGGWREDFVQPALGGLGVSQAFTAVVNLWPMTSTLSGLQSDGRQILAFLTAKPSPPDAFTEAAQRAQGHLFAERYAAAAEAFWEAAQLKPDAPYAFALTLHCLNRAQGDVAALTFFRSHRAAFETSMTTTNEADRALVPYLQANIAMPALSGDLALADLYSQAALNALPEAPPMVGARGAYLVATGEIAEGREMLLRAIRSSDVGSDRAELAEALARAARAAGDAERAGAFEDLGRYARVA